MGEQGNKSCDLGENPSEDESPRAKDKSSSMSSLPPDGSPSASSRKGCRKKRKKKIKGGLGNNEVNPALSIEDLFVTLSTAQVRSFSITLYLTPHDHRGTTYYGSGLNVDPKEFLSWSEPSNQPVMFLAFSIFPIPIMIR